MGLLSKLKKIHKKIDPIGNKVHSKTGGKIESKLEGKTPLGRLVDKKPTASRTTAGSAKPSTDITKPMMISGKPTGGNAKPVRGGGSFNAAGGARLNKLAGLSRRNRTK